MKCDQSMMIIKSIVTINVYRSADFSPHKMF